MNNESNIWRSLEQDFRAIPDRFHLLRADYHEYNPDPSGLSGWSLAGGTRFKAIAVLAGKALWRDESLKSILPADVVVELDPFNRWLTAVRLMTSGFDATGLGHTDEKAPSRILLGCIYDIVEKSALLCLQLAGSTTASDTGAAALKGRKSFKQNLSSPLHEAVKRAIDEERLSGKRLWIYVDGEAHEDPRIKPLPPWRDLWPTGPRSFEKAYRAPAWKRKLNSFVYRVRRSPSHSSD